MTDELSERDRRILDFEQQWWRYQGAKEEAVRREFELSATRYYQILTGLLDTPQALAYAPMTVKRLRRLRSDRRSSRGHRGVG